MLKGTHKTIRKWIEDREAENLSDWACLAGQSRGRPVPEDPHPCRTAFQRDRGRIIHSKSFRRLKDKTQVFLTPTGDHYRTRLTHTLEVTQVSRTIARALGLNEDLTEAISLAHDLGHTPFGHAGEEVLEKKNPSGFSHTLQSLRVVEKLESRGEHRGLNLTYEVLDGIAGHSKAAGDLFSSDTGDFPSTLEGEVARLSDAIAYINHDIEDSLRAGILNREDLPEDAMALLGGPSGELIDVMAMDVILNSQEGSIRMSSEVREAANALRNFLYDNVFPSESVRKELRKAQNCLELIYEYLMKHPEEVPEHYRVEDEDTHRWVTDFISGMTDRYAMDFYRIRFLPDISRI